VVGEKSAECGTGRPCVALDTAALTDASASEATNVALAHDLFISGNGWQLWRVESGAERCAVANYQTKMKV